MSSITRSLATAAIAVALVSSGSAAEAKDGGPHKARCKVTTSTIVESRDVSGVIMAPGVIGDGVQTRTKVTTSTRCRGKITASTVTYSAWSY